MKRVLIIEDQVKLRRNLRQVLEEEGYQVVALQSEEGTGSTFTVHFPQASGPSDISRIGPLSPNKSSPHDKTHYRH